MPLLSNRVQFWAAGVLGEVVTRALPLASHGSADLAAACEADGTIPVGPKTEYAAGDIVTFRPWGPMQ